MPTSHSSIEGQPAIAHQHFERSGSRKRIQQSTAGGLGQFAFDFETTTVVPVQTAEAEITIPDGVRMAARDYQLQMQSYALAVRELLPHSRARVFELRAISWSRMLSFN